MWALAAGKNKKVLRRNKKRREQKRDTPP